MLPFYSPSQFLHTAQVCLTYSLLSGQFSNHIRLLSWLNVAIFLPHTRQPSHWLRKEASPQGLLTQTLPNGCFTLGEVDLASSALLHIWLNTKGLLCGPCAPSNPGCSNSFSFVYHSANICPMQKFYLQKFDTYCCIRCKHRITFDLQLILAEQFWEVLPSQLILSSAV